mmetsp:Transcript_38412/g.78391  ORF Transcript_38412/g.78391 Transcript_38412/m.78391 type:complete len:185 (-) Transcript_38412:183-737(-)
MLASEMHAEMNRAMTCLVPELDSEAALIPLRRDRWLRPDETYERSGGVPCYVFAPIDEGPKKDYIYCPQRGDDQPAGYYHLRTREGHIQAYLCLKQARKQHKCNGPMGLLFSHKSREEKGIIKHENEMYDKVETILHNRMLYGPHDIYSARMRLLNVQATGSTVKHAGKAAYLPALASALLIGL